jgi:mRNA interferase HigB
MRIVGRDKLDAFCSRHADARPWIEAWLYETEGMSWTTPQDIRNRHAMASILQSQIVIFNVRGNRCRLEVHVAFKNGIVTVRWIGTHSEYDQRNRTR